MNKSVEITGWVARDEDGSLHLFETNPERIAECAWAEYPGHTLGVRLPNDSFPSVTWESEPVKATVAVSVSEVTPKRVTPNVSLWAWYYILFFGAFCFIIIFMDTEHDSCLGAFKTLGWIVGITLFLTAMYFQIKDTPETRKGN